MTDVVQITLTDTLVLFVLRRVPIFIVFDVVDQEGDEAVVQALDEIWNLAHHTRRTISRLGERHQELSRQRSRAILEVVMFRDAEHRFHELDEMIAHESRIGFSELDEQRESLLRRRLILTSQRRTDRVEHRRQQILELHSIARIFQRIDERTRRS